MRWKPGGQHREKTASKFVGGKCHHLVALGTFEAVVLPLEGDSVVIAGDQAARETLSTTLTPSTAAGGAEGERWTG
jgi:hypothetical protein